MTAIPKGDAMPNKNVISRDPNDPAIKALQALPPERIEELQKLDNQLQEIQQRSLGNIQDRSVEKIMSIVTSEKTGITFQKEVEVRTYGSEGPLTIPGKAPLGRRLFPNIQAPTAFNNTKINSRFQGCFEQPLDEEIFAHISWIAEIGTKSKEALISK